MWALFPKKAYDITKKLLSDCNLFSFQAFFFSVSENMCLLLLNIAKNLRAISCCCFFVYLAIYDLRLALLGVNKSQIIFSHKKCHISWCIQFQFHCQFFSLWDFSLSQSFPFFPFLLLCKDPTLNLSSRNGALHNFLLYKFDGCKNVL